MGERSDGHWRGSTLLGILAQERQPGDPVDSDDPDDPLGQFLQVSEIQKRVRLRWDQIRAAQLEGGAEALGMGLDAFRVANAQTKLVLTCVSPIPTASRVPFHAESAQARQLRRWFGHRADEKLAAQTDAIGKVLRDAIRSSRSLGGRAMKSIKVTIAIEV